ncbi:MAG TPA: hypothetical protein PK513_07810 [Alphaproteobacteria bacterium]|nr:hypothetical protein [Alphaproteobacteria bacterium]USO05150.1 MAG: hypothetical protein H6859_08325 [Rhodospirillales bacterium]HOO82391.1 hypothetical protein [Alphaproteobacteria bacterium]
MDQNAAYLLQMLETLGAPLMSAIVSAQPLDQSTTLQSEAQSIAALLGKTVETSIDLGQIMDINPAEAQDDTLRVALAGLAGPLVAGQYVRRGQVPETADLKKITNALQAVLSFSDNFTPTAETIGRLKNLQASGQIVDSYQTQIQYMQAFIPVIDAIAAFPFGQPEAKLIMDVSARLVKKAVDLRETLLPGIDDEAVQKRTELGLLNAVATLYSNCHKAETDKVLNTEDTSREGGLSIEPVWTAFETRAAMLEALAARIAPGGVKKSDDSSSKAPVSVLPTIAPQEPVSPPPAETQQPQEPVIPKTPVAAAPSIQPPAEIQAQGNPPGQNPMAMFAKSKTDAAAPSEPPQAPPIQSPPQVPPASGEKPPVPAAPPPPPEQPSPAAPPVLPSDQSGENSGSGPMSFFTKKGEE